MPFYDQQAATGVTQPRDNEPPWLYVGYGFLFFLLASGFWFGVGGTKIYLLLILIAAIACVFTIPRDADLGLVRLLAVLIFVLIVILLVISGLPLAVAEALRPVGQGVQDQNTAISASLMMAWLLVMVAIAVACAFWSVISFISGSTRRIILAGFILGVASFPIVGMLTQGALRNPGGY